MIMENKSYPQRYISYIKKWQKDNIQLRAQLGHEAFFVMSCIQANIHVPLVEWKNVKPILDEMEKQYELELKQG